MNAPVRIETGVVDIRGKQYQTVALRVQLFRQSNPEHGLITEVVERDADCVVMRASIFAPDGRLIATGHSEEYRKSSQINRTSALENAETSAIGRALAAFGIGGTEFATANEVQNAIHQQSGERGDGRSVEHEVSRPPANSEPSTSKGWREPDSIYSTPSKLAAAMRGLERELHGCGDAEMVYGVTQTAEWIEFVRVATIHAPHYLRGGEPAPPEFEGLQNTAERMVREFDSATADGMVATYHT